jgi:uncharacterized membrane protein
MSELVVVTYRDVYWAGEVCAALQRLHEEFLIDIEDVAYITAERKGQAPRDRPHNVHFGAHGLGQGHNLGRTDWVDLP